MHDEEMTSDSTEFWERRNDITPSTDAGRSVEEYRLALVAYDVGGRPPTYNQLETDEL